MFACTHINDVSTSPNIAAGITSLFTARHINREVLIDILLGDIDTTDCLQRFMVPGTRI